MRFPKRKQFDPKKGSEILEFAMVIPGLVMLIVMVVMIIQLGLVRNAAVYALDLSSRAAAICEDYETAYTAMDNVAKSTLSASTFGLTDEDIHCELELIAGTTATPGAASSSGGITWEKGALAACTIEVNVKTFLNIGSPKMRVTMCVMVERPVRSYA